MRLGKTMSDAMMSMMASSDNELERGQVTWVNITVVLRLARRARCLCGETNLKAGLSKRLVAPVQLISRVWKGGLHVIDCTN